MKEFIEIPFGAKDSELGGWEYTIPEGFVASIENGMIIVKKEESEDERIRKYLLKLAERCPEDSIDFMTEVKKEDVIAWLEKQGDIDRRIQEEIEKQTKQQWKTERQGEQKPTDKVEQNMELTDFESALFTAFSDAWQQYLDGKEVNVAQWAKEHSTELLEVSRKEHVEWSEEDEYVYNEILKRVADKKLYEHDLEYIYKWLKSLKPQNNWKPSAKQLKKLHYAMQNFVGETFKVLNSLYEQLKKL